MAEHHVMNEIHVAVGLGETLAVCTQLVCVRTAEDGTTRVAQHFAQTRQHLLLRRLVVAELVAIHRRLIDLSLRRRHLEVGVENAQQHQRRFAVRFLCLTFGLTPQRGATRQIDNDVSGRRLRHRRRDRRVFSSRRRCRHRVSCSTAVDRKWGGARACCSCGPGGGAC